MTRPLGFVLRLGPRTDRARSAAVVAVALLQQATGVGLALLLGLVSEAAVRRSTSGVLIAALIVTVFVVLTQGTFVAGFFSRLRLREEMQHEAEREFIGAVGGTPTLEVHERPDRGDRVAAFRAAREDVGQSFDTVLVLIGATLLLLTSIAVIATVVPMLVVLPLFALPALFATRWADRERGAASGRALPHTRLANHLFAFATTAAYARESRLFGLADELRRRHRTQWEAAGREVAATEARTWAPVALAWILFVTAYAGALVLLVRAGLQGHASLGHVVAAVAVTSQLTGQVQAVLTWSYWALEAVRGARALLDVVRDGERERETTVPRDPVPVPARLTGGIRLEQVEFRYWDRERPALRGVDLDLPAGTVVAIVGENGAGKSTLIKVLAGLYRPTAGRVLADGTDLTHFDPEQWHRAVTAAFQDPARLEMSLRDAVGLGDLARRTEPDVVDAALQRAGGDRLVADLPQGAETRLGRRSWDGRELSGGQWQTVANARAGMRPGPLLRVLDEPTSSLDARAEELLFARYAELGRLEGGVTVLVTHRFTTARVADLVVVLADGAVAEFGTHETLNRAGGVYAEMLRLQARYFI